MKNRKNLLTLIMVSILIFCSSWSVQKKPAAVAGSLPENELIAAVVRAQAEALNLYAGAFHAELDNQDKTAWNEVRAQLLPYWSAQLLDGKMEEFYNRYLWDWGFEMGFAFPLNNPAMIERADIMFQRADKARLRFVALTNYDTFEALQVTLILTDHGWVVDAIAGESESLLAAY